MIVDCVEFENAKTGEVWSISRHPEHDTFWKANWPDPRFNRRPDDIDISIVAVHHEIAKDFEAAYKHGAFNSLDSFCGILANHCLGQYPSHESARSYIKVVSALCTAFYGSDVLAGWNLLDEKLCVVLDTQAVCLIG